MSIAQTQEASAEIVLQERVVTTEYKIIEINEYIKERRVVAVIELGPFVEEQRFGDQTELVAKGGQRRIELWVNEAYDEVRDTWANSDLMAAIAEKM